MKEDKFLLVSLDDEKSKAVAKVLSSKTCKKMINYLAENQEASEKDLSEKLQIPINTAEYNIKKLVESGFVQKKKNFFWSKKGKKIVLYELSNKSIIISHKKPVLNKIKSITPAVIIAAAGTFAIWAYQKIVSSESLSSCTEKGSTVCSYGAVNTVAAPIAVTSTIVSSPAWEWFLFGSLVAILIIMIINWKKL